MLRDLRRPFRQQLRFTENDSGGHEIELPIVVWRYDSGLEQWRKQKEQPRSSLPMAVQQTWAWCRHFVLPLQLCPWARGSLETPSALQIFLVDNPDINPKGRDFYSKLVEDVGYRLQGFLEDASPTMESAVIFFVVFADKIRNDQFTEPTDFGDFYDWFLDLEDNWKYMDSVIVAPFHPDWAFMEEPESLQFEKRSPYPTVTLVSAKVVDAAGEAATEKIGKDNERKLLSKPLEELQTLWNQCILPNNKRTGSGVEEE